MSAFSHRLSRRGFMQIAGLAAAANSLPEALQAQGAPDVRIEIAPFSLQLSAKRHIRTLAYNGCVPGPVIRLKEGQPYSVEVVNHSANPEVLHWHGLHLSSEIDGAMEEGTPAIAPGASVRYSLTPRPAGFRWYHTHTFAGKDLTRAQYGGLHGFLLVEPRQNPGRYDRELFLNLHDWEGQFQGGDDGYMNPVYEVSTINGKTLGFGDPVRVKQGERVLLHLLNSSPTETHFLAFSGHLFQVLALDGNPVPQPRSVPQLRLAPAERVSALLEMNNPGVWVLGEVRKHIQAAGMGIVIEYAGAGGKPVWNQPESLLWNYEQFAAPPAPASDASPITLVFDSKFQGHGNEELWRINGRSFPQTESPVLRQGQRYRLRLKNASMDDHPMHLHRHTFEVRQTGDGAAVSGLRKDVLLVRAGKTAEVEFTADNPGPTLFHCHQQDHMDRGFMMVFQYA